MVPAGPVFSHVCIPLATAFSIGVHDSSGMEFFYTSSPREFDAGILYLGDQVGINEVVPPNAVDYQIFGWCPSDCTDKVCSYLHIKAYGCSLGSYGRYRC